MGNTVPFDPKKNALAALKFGLISAAGVFLADQAGITSWLMTYVPAQYANVGPIIIGMALASLKNWISNRNK